MEGGPTAKRARVKQEFDSRVISIPGTAQIPYDDQNDADHSLVVECDDNSNEQFESVDVPIEYAEETFPVDFMENRLKTEGLKNANPQIILCQPNDTLETVKISWTPSMTYILIEEYRKLMPEFQDPHKKQRDSWVNVAKNMCRRGCDVNWEMCDQKWRNLKHTFKSIYYNKHRSERSKQRWDFYRVLADVFGPQLRAEDMKKADVSPKFSSDDISSKTEPGGSKKSKSQTDSVSYQMPISYNSSTSSFEVFDGESQCDEKVTESANENTNSVPPLWFKEFLKEYRETEDQRLALIREMHNDLLQVEQRKVAALESLLMKLFER